MHTYPYLCVHIYVSCMRVRWKTWHLAAAPLLTSSYGFYSIAAPPAPVEGPCLLSPLVMFINSNSACAWRSEQGESAAFCSRDTTPFPVWWHQSLYRELPVITRISCQWPGDHRECLRETADLVTPWFSCVSCSYRSLFCFWDRVSCSLH